MDAGPLGWMNAGIVRRLGMGLLLLMLVQLGLQPVHGASPANGSVPAGLTAQDWAAIQTALPPVPQAYLKASNTGSDDGFGFRVAVSGDTVVVSAPREDSAATGVNGNQADNTAFNAGAAYVFVRTGPGWSQQAYLKASNSQAGDYFGYGVAIDGDTIVVGADGEDSAATGVNGNQADNSASSSGAAYVFVRTGTTWTQQAYLKASNTGVDDSFGYAVAVDGDLIVVGAMYERSAATGVDGNQTDNSIPQAGAAYVFARIDNTQGAPAWTQQAYLKASNTQIYDEFGSTVAVSGETVVVGADSEDSAATGINGNQQDNSAQNAGAVYIYTRTGTSWHQQTYLKASNTSSGDGFGTAVAIDGDTLVVGAYGESSAATGVNGDQTNNSAFAAGAAYVFVRSSAAGASTWVQQAYLKASNTGSQDQFGGSVAIAGDRILVGASFESSSATGVNGDQANNSLNWAGAAYLFGRSGPADTPTWSQHGYLKASNTEAFDAFGLRLGISNDIIVVGAVNESSAATGVNGFQADNSASYAGAAYVFGATPFPTLTATSGTPQSTLVNTPFSNQLQATFRDTSNNPLANVEVTFSAPLSRASGSFPSGNTALTDANGQVSIPFTANTVAGSYYVEANVSPALASPAMFRLTNTPGAPAVISVLQGTSQSALINNFFFPDLKVKVADAYNNPLRGLVVTFSAPTSGASVTFPYGNTATTDFIGEAILRVRANSIAGSYTITANASSSEADPAKFELTNRPGAAAAIITTAGTPQSAPIYTPFASQLQVTVLDAYNNPISGQLVIFTPSETRASGTFPAGNTALTNASGQASVPITANGTPGSYSVTARLRSGLGSPASFALTNTR